MKKLFRILRSFHKNIILKRKFKAYWMSFVDRGYRAEIENLYELTKHSSKTDLLDVPAELLIPGHRIIYPKYVEELIIDHSRNLEPIKVVALKDKFLVIDGNHRLPAILARGKKFVQCEVIS